jgi:hypothetical protein
VIKRINYTGRKRIRRDDARFVVHAVEGGSPTFDVHLNLLPYRLPETAAVSVEAYRQTSWMRFSVGTVRTLSPTEGHELSAFATADAVLFRVRVTATDGVAKRLLAEADGIAGLAEKEEHANREPLLPVKGEDLDAEVWRVETEPRPLLKVNTKCGDWRTIAREPFFVSLVYPAALRMVLRAVVLDDDWRDEGDETWQGKWVRFARAIPGVEALPEQIDAREAWIEDVGEAFCRQLKMSERFVGFWTKEIAR